LLGARISITHFIRDALASGTSKSFRAMGQTAFQPIRPCAKMFAPKNFGSKVTGPMKLTICFSFWLASALTIVGEVQRARDLMEQLLRIAFRLGLYAEEFEPTMRHLGNFSQAFSHLALIDAAVRMVVVECRLVISIVTAPRGRPPAYVTGLTWGER
jgi:hypothetical protein